MTDPKSPRSRSASDPLRLAAIATGWLLVVAGIAALFLPLPGLLLLVPGLALLTYEYVWAA